MTKTVTAPAEYWVVNKNGVAVAKYKTREGMQHEIPDTCTVAAALKQDDKAISDLIVDTSVLTDGEEQTLGVYHI